MKTLSETSSDRNDTRVAQISGYGHQASSQINFIRDSLQFQKEALSQLFAKMDSFTGLNEDEKAELRVRLDQTYAHSKQFYSGAIHEAFIESQFQSMSSDQFVFVTRYSTPFMNLAIPIILTACSLGEALINSLVAFGLTRAGMSKLFAVFDRMDLKEKWRLGPLLFCPSVAFDLGSHHFESLNKLVTLRNAFTHSKVEISSTDQKQRIKGTAHHRVELSPRGYNLLLSFIELPDQLFDLVVAGIPDSSLKWTLESASFRFSV